MCLSTQVVTVDMMDSLIGYEIPVKFLEVDEVSFLGSWLQTRVSGCKLSPLRCSKL